MELSNLAILTLNGELTDVKMRGEHSCLVYSREPISFDLLEELQMRIGAVTSGCEAYQTAGKTDFTVICELLAEYEIKVLDVSNISVDGPGRGWVQLGGYNYHSNKLQRLQLGIDRKENN
jgi:hypothetical protein